MVAYSDPFEDPYALPRREAELRTNEMALAREGKGDLLLGGGRSSPYADPFNGAQPQAQPGAQVVNPFETQAISPFDVVPPPAAQGPSRAPAQLSHRAPPSAALQPAGATMQPVSLRPGLGGFDNMAARIASEARAREMRTQSFRGGLRAGGLGANVAAPEGFVDNGSIGLRSVPQADPDGTIGRAFISPEWADALDMQEQYIRRNSPFIDERGQRLFRPNARDNSAYSHQALPPDPRESIPFQPTERGTELVKPADKKKAAQDRALARIAAGREKAQKKGMAEREQGLVAAETSMINSEAIRRDVAEKNFRATFGDELTDAILASGKHPADYQGNQL